jgi:hypothetical protein
MPRSLGLLTAAVLVLACGGDDDGGDATGVVTAPVDLATATSTGGTGDKPTPAPTPAPGEVSVANEAFSVETPDGVLLKGHLYSPDGPKRQALIIVAPVEQSIWAESTQAFTSEGIAVFTFDLRGFGETGGEEAEGQALAADLRLLTRFAISREYPLVYLLGIGETGGVLVTDGPTFQDLEAVEGIVTYGYEGEASEDILVLAPDASWAAEAVLADLRVSQAVLDFVLEN